MPVPEYLEYPDVFQESRGHMYPGRLRLQQSNLLFRNAKSGKTDQVAGEQIIEASWLARARGCCIRLVTDDGSVYRYDGLKESQYDEAASYMKQCYGKDLKKTERCVKGFNWGSTEFRGNSMAFNIDNNMAFELPLQNVSNCVVNKNEATVSFVPNDDAAVCLMEMRFHIPAETAAEDFQRNVVEYADIIQATGEAVAKFSEVQILTPRGRYEVRFYATFVELHGKSFDFKIPYKHILRMFLLPHKDNRQFFYVIALDPPIKYGASARYPFVIMLFSRESHMTIQLTPPSDEIDKEYGGKLQKEMSGPEHELISRLFKSLSKAKIIVPGGFKGKSGTPAISCSHKTATGLVYPLERGFIYVHKPPVHVRFDEVEYVNFARGTSSMRTFDFEIQARNGLLYTFSSIEKDEYSLLFDFVKGKKLSIRNVGDKTEAVAYDDMTESDEDAAPDYYAERMKREGLQRADDDEDEEEDSDYAPAAEGSGSEVAEEFDSDAAESSSDNEAGTSSMKRKGTKKPDKPRAKKSKVTKKAKDGESPKKDTTGAGSQFKSSEYVEDTSSASSDEEAKAKPTKSGQTKKAKEKEKSPMKESDDDGDDSVEDAADNSEDKPAEPSTRSTRSRRGQDTELTELPELPSDEEEAEASGVSDTSSSEDDD